MTTRKPKRARKKPPARKPLDRDEAILILESIAREGSDTARIQAIKELRRLEEGGADGPDELEELIRRK